MGAPLSHPILAAIDSMSDTPVRVGLFPEYAAMKAAQALVNVYGDTGDDHASHRHDVRALEIQGGLIAQLTSFSGLTADQLREVLCG